MRLRSAKLGMSKNIRTRDGARHFVTKITLPKASDVTPFPLKNSGVLGDLKKWSKNHWGGGRPLLPPRSGAPEGEGLRWAEYIFIPCHRLHELVQTGGAMASSGPPP